MKEALTGNIKAHHRQELSWAKQEYEMYQLQILECLSQMHRICDEHFSVMVKLLQTIPGINQIAAMTIIAETGGDMGVFENSDKIVGWAGLRPRNDESAGKYKSTATTKGNKYFRTILVQVAWAASRTKGSFFKEKHFCSCFTPAQHVLQRVLLRKHLRLSLWIHADQSVLASFHIHPNMKTY